MAARTKFQETAGSTAATDSDTASSRSYQAAAILSKALPLAHQAAQIIRDFRQRYGLKISPAWLLQLQAVAVGVLLQDLSLTNTMPPPSPRHDDSLDTITDSHEAFDEVFRSLLGTGVGVMIARGIARMTYHNALQQKVPLSKRTRSLLKIMSDTAWRPSDLGFLNSSFPNFAAIGNGDNSGRRGMTDLLREWERMENGGGGLCWHGEMNWWVRARFRDLGLSARAVLMSVKVPKTASKGIESRLPTPVFLAYGHIVMSSSSV